jgi:hypothetical protein
MAQQLIASDTGALGQLTSVPKAESASPTSAGAKSTCWQSPHQVFVSAGSDAGDWVNYRLQVRIRLWDLGLLGRLRHGRKGDNGSHEPRDNSLRTQHVLEVALDTIQRVGVKIYPGQLLQLTYGDLKNGRAEVDVDRLVAGPLAILCLCYASNDIQVGRLASYSEASPPLLRRPRMPHILICGWPQAKGRMCKA